MSGLWVRTSSTACRHLVCWLPSPTFLCVLLPRCTTCNRFEFHRIGRERTGDQLFDMWCFCLWRRNTRQKDWQNRPHSSECLFLDICPVQRKEEPEYFSKEISYIKVFLHFRKKEKGQTLSFSSRRKNRYVLFLLIYLIYILKSTVTYTNWKI